MLLLLVLLFATPAHAADPACRNSEKCFALGMTDVTVNPELQHTVGSWPFPRVAKVRAYVGDVLKFEWDSRNEFYSQNQRKWMKRESGLRSVWETADGSKDPCAKAPSRPFNAFGQTGRHEEILPACAAGKTYRVRIVSDHIRPKQPDGILELTVLPADRRPASRAPANDGEDPAPAVKPQPIPKAAQKPKPVQTISPDIQALDDLL
ncbi:MAG TPA: hypothetical protein VM598_13040 [Bdellovibrionota bacterium]|nr:hypothetical protein [Bdellovibrionota bacterium]